MLTTDSVRKFNGGTIRRILAPWFSALDKPLLIIILLILFAGMLTLYSASDASWGKMQGQCRNIFVCIAVMIVVSRIPPHVMQRFAVYAYTAGIVLLVAVLLFGIVKKGARRWINLGMVIQPSEIMKIAVPLMLAWYFQHKEGLLRWKEFLIAGILLALPVALIMKQPDLGTAMLVFGTGFCVLFLAGLSWKVIIGAIVCVLCSLPIVWNYVLHDYQKHRVLMLLDPSSDPLGKGFHIIQSTIAIGSGSLFGKGWMSGTQSHLDFLPERTTDFIFAVYSEEFGLLGNIVLLFLFIMLIIRGIVITSNAPTLFSRLLAGAITLMFFNYAFVNMGMVSGILPVVGVPLPFISYGGTALMTLGLGAGILMSIQKHRRLMQT